MKDKRLIMANAFSSFRVYEEITLDYPLAAAKSFASLSKPFKFVYVSGNQLFQSFRVLDSQENLSNTSIY